MKRCTCGARLEPDPVGGTWWCPNGWANVEHAEVTAESKP